MKQILVISGKGGTGKTIMTASFACLADNNITADCDVDAADMHLLMRPKIKERHAFRSGATAFIHEDKCTKCGQCAEICRFDAINKDIVLDPISCEGCGFCARACPAQAIEMKENNSGEWFISETPFGDLVHAKLGIAEENSGKLVSLVRQKAKDLADQKRSNWVIVDGSPGIGCPVIASLSGIDLAVVVTEPSLSGLHDAQRVIKLAKHFGVKTNLVINKYDLNESMSKKILDYCSKDDIPVIGKIRFDKTVVDATVAGKIVVEYAQSEAAKEIRNAWNAIKGN